jgi:hypothetical protein
LWNRDKSDGRQFGCGKGGSGCIFRAYGWGHGTQGVQGPGDVEGWVIPEDATFARRVIEVGGLVEDFG